MPVENVAQASPRGAKGDDVVRYFRSAIRSGRCVPGQRLTEADLTAELGVSRSLLREAFRRLAAEGLVEIIPNRGALVRRLSFRETMELFEIRFELEALAARLAAVEVLDRAVRGRFEEDVAAIWSSEPRLSTSAYLVENERFHTALFTASGNGQLDVLNRRLQLSLLMAQISNALTPATMARSLAEHRAIATAVHDGDVAAADAGVRAHLSRARDLVAGMPDSVFRRE